MKNKKFFVYHPDKDKNYSKEYITVQELDKPNDHVGKSYQSEIIEAINSFHEKFCKKL